MNRYLPDNIWKGFFCKLVTLRDGVSVREWEVYDEGRLVLVASRKELAERMWIKYKLGGK